MAELPSTDNERVAALYVAWAMVEKSAVSTAEKQDFEAHKKRIVEAYAAVMEAVDKANKGAGSS